MPRAINGTVHKNRRAKILKLAKGFRGGRSKLFRTAKSAVMKAGQWAYRDRRVRKREFRKLWIVRINAAVRENGLSYSKFINLLNKSSIRLDRRVLAELAFKDKVTFDAIVNKVKASA